MKRRRFIVALATLSASTLIPRCVLAARSTIAHIHGTIVSIDRKRGTFRIHHDPFALMPMAMTMDVEPRHPAEFAALRVGETVDATIDTSIVPWPASRVVRAH